MDAKKTAIEAIVKITGGLQYFKNQLFRSVV
jgi:hypothetical protein